MRIEFDPIRSDEVLDLSVSGDALTINGEVLDFSTLAEGFKLPPAATGNRWIIGSVKRQGGEISVRMLAPYDGGAGEGARERYAVDVADGVVEMRK